MSIFQVKDIWLLIKHGFIFFNLFVFSHCINKEIDKRNVSFRRKIGVSGMKKEKEKNDRISAIWPVTS